VSQRNTRAAKAARRAARAARRRAQDQQAAGAEVHTLPELRALAARGGLLPCGCPARSALADLLAVQGGGPQ